jgi:C4-type Zn-finger protein
MVKTKKVTSIDELMKSIRKNTKGSGCIDNFEGLLREIKDPRICNVVVSEMSGF